MIKPWHYIKITHDNNLNQVLSAASEYFLTAISLPPIFRHHTAAMEHLLGTHSAARETRQHLLNQCPWN